MIPRNIFNLVKTVTAVLNTFLSKTLSYFSGNAKFEKSKIKTKTKTETKAGEPARGRGGLCPPLGPPVGRFPRFVSVFVFVLIFDFSNFDFSKYFGRKFWICLLQGPISQLKDVTAEAGSKMSRLSML